VGRGKEGKIMSKDKKVNRGEKGTIIGKNHLEVFEIEIREVINKHVRETSLWPKYLYLGKKEINKLLEISKKFNLEKTNGEIVEVLYYENIRVIEVKEDSFLRVGN